MARLRDVFNDAKWVKIRRAVERAGNAHVKIGVLASKGGNEQATSGDISMVELAAIHEFGSPAAGIQQRSFIRSTFKVHKTKELEAFTRRLALEIIDKETPIETALAKLGTWGVAQVKNTIKSRQTVGPEEQANAPSTIARKGSSTPLVDTGRLINAISFEVVLHKLEGDAP